MSQPALSRRTALAGAIAGWCATCCAGFGRTARAASVRAEWGNGGCEAIPEAMGAEHRRLTSLLAAKAAAPGAPTQDWDTPRSAHIFAEGLRIEVLYFPAAPRNASPGDDPSLPAGTHPPHVHATLAAARHAVTTFRKLGLAAPVAGKDGLVIHLWKLDGFRGQAYPGPSDRGRIVIERSLRGRALRTTVAHEIFHCVQYAYNNIEVKADQDWARSDHRPSIAAALREGGARMAEFLAGDGGERYEDEVDTWFGETPPPLFSAACGPAGRMTGASYAASLFWKYIAEQHGPADADPTLQVARTQRILLEATSKAAKLPDFPPGSDNFGLRMFVADLRRARARMNGPGHFDRFWYMDDALVCGETTWGNFLVALVLNGKAGADSRFRFVDALRFSGPGEGRQAVPVGRTHHLGELPRRDVLLPQREAADGEPMLRPYAMRTHRILVSATQAALVRPDKGGEDPESGRPLRLVPTDGGLLRVRCRPVRRLGDMLVQVVFLDRAGRLADLYRHDGATMGGLDRTFSCHGMSEVAVIVASREEGGDYALSLTQPDPAPLLYGGSMNALAGRHLTVDPAVRRFDWLSPNLRVLGSQAGAFVVAALLNRGTKVAEGVTMQCHRRRVHGGGAPGVWEALAVAGTKTTPVISALAECADAARQAVPPKKPALATCNIQPFGDDQSAGFNQNKSAQFRWPDGEPRDYVLRLTAEAPGDPNGKLVLLSMGGPRPPPPPSSEWVG
ncbi:MAG: hypothetical protein IT555_18175 [Acetobacteraceae bacterium]|nr:hypothetical protein [Acetobacteraceae bacterium]